MPTQANEKYRNLISALSEEDFYELIKNYLKQYWNTKEVNITNGPYDGGLDLVVYVNGKPIKRNIQITIQKTSIETKIKKDIDSAQFNITNYGFEPVVDYYITFPLTQSFKNKMIHYADTAFAITLKIFDANKLSEDSEDYSSIKESLNIIYDVDNLKASLKIDKQTKVLFDMLAMGDGSSKIKNQFIDSFILFYLFRNPLSTIENISDSLNLEIEHDYDRKFYANHINLLRQKDSIIANPLNKHELKLSEEVCKKIEDILNLANAKENALIADVTNLLLKFNLEGLADDIVKLLQVLYKENYEIDIEEITGTGNSYNSSVKKTYNALLKYLKGKGVKQIEDRRKIIAELLNIGNENDFLNKTSASVMFISLYKSNKLEAYINQKPKLLVIDTQVLIYLICYEYRPIEFNDVLYKSVIDLVEFCKKNSNRIRITTTYDYILEAAGQILDALKLERFLSLPYMASLGKSKNIFFNYFIALQESGLTDFENFKEFIYDLAPVNLDIIDRDTINLIGEDLIDQLSFIDIEVINHPLYNDYSAFKKEYETLLAYNNKNKTFYAIENDVRAILYLCTTDYHINVINGEYNEPYFITWDSSFYEFRDVINTKFISNRKYNGAYSNFYIYTPSKILDRLTLENFRINTQSVNYNIIALAESIFNLSSEKISFIDLISSIFNKEDVSNLKLAQKFADIRKKQFEELEHSKEDEPKEVNLPIDEVLLKFLNYYRKGDSPFKVQDMSGAFENQDFVDSIVDVVLESIELVVRHKQIEPGVLQKMDKIIEESIEKTTK